MQLVFNFLHLAMMACGMLLSAHAVSDGVGAGTRADVSKEMKCLKLYVNLIFQNKLKQGLG